jgi:hypothetical protein
MRSKLPTPSGPYQIGLTELVIQRRGGEEILVKAWFPLFKVTSGEKMSSYMERKYYKKFANIAAEIHSRPNLIYNISNLVNKMAP